MNTFVTAKENNITETELAAILLYYYTNNATFAWSNTVGINKLSKNKSINAASWFKSEKIQNVTYFVKKQIEKDAGLFDADEVIEKNENKIKFDPDEDINSDNIKKLLQSEFNKTTDPEKRTVLLIKIADFIGLKNSDQEDPLTPTIYLPDRCQYCELAKTGIQKTANEHE